MPRKARRLTDDEKMAFVEAYQQGEPIADLAAKLGVHRTTLDNLSKRLELSREDPDAVAPAVQMRLQQIRRRSPPPPGSPAPAVGC